jgi:hypothetical protein
MSIDEGLSGAAVLELIRPCAIRDCHTPKEFKYHIVRHSRFNFPFLVVSLFLMIAADLVILVLGSPNAPPTLHRRRSK